MAVIKVEGLRKQFGGVMAVDGVDLEVQRGEVVGLLGPSGCGKTTTLRCIAGLEQPSGGRIELDGTVVNDGPDHLPPERRGVGMVFQSYALWPHMTVEKNISFPLVYSNVPKQEHGNRVAQVMEAVGLEGLGGRYPSELSGGQQQRVAVARAIAPEPAVLLFDEPLSNLDAKLRNHVRLELKVLLRRLNATALYVTHDQKEAMALCDRIAVMSSGVIKQIGTPEEIYERPVDTFVASFVGDTNLLQFTVDSPTGSPPVMTIAGKQLPAGDNVPVHGAETGAAVLRPEHIDLMREAVSDRFGWTAEVEERLFLGTHIQYLVKLIETGDELKVDARDVRLELASTCFVAPNVDKIVWLPSDAAEPIARDDESGATDSGRVEPVPAQTTPTAG